MQTGTTLLRVGSTATGGVGNPVINTAEIASSFSLSVVTVVLPLLALAVITLIGWGVRQLLQRRALQAQSRRGDAHVLDAHDRLVFTPGSALQ
ncbi:MAG: DUF4126 domain-containing protein [Caldilineaceae bacterium]